MFGRATIRLGIGPHSSSIIISLKRGYLCSFHNAHCCHVMFDCMGQCLYVCDWVKLFYDITLLVSLCANVDQWTYTLHNAMHACIQVHCNNLILPYRKPVLWCVSCRTVCCRELVTVKTNILMLTGRRSSCSSLIVFGKWPNKYVVLFNLLQNCSYYGRATE